MRPGVEPDLARRATDLGAEQSSELEAAPQKALPVDPPDEAVGTGPLDRFKIIKDGRERRILIKVDGPDRDVSDRCRDRERVTGRSQHSPHGGQSRPRRARPGRAGSGFLAAGRRGARKAVIDRFQQRRVERRKIIGLPAGDQVAVDDDLLIDPLATGIADVGLHAGPGGEPLAAYARQPRPGSRERGRSRRPVCPTRRSS